MKSWKDPSFIANRFSFTILYFGQIQLLVI